MFSSRSKPESQLPNLNLPLQKSTLQRQDYFKRIHRTLKRGQVQISSLEGILPKVPEHQLYSGPIFSGESYYNVNPQDPDPEVQSL